MTCAFAPVTRRSYDRRVSIDSAASTPPGLTNTSSNVVPDILSLVVSAALILGLRAHAWSAPLEADECNYLYIGQRLALGDRLYLDVWDHQPPGMFALTALLARTVGTSEAAYRVFSSAVALAGLLLVFALARRCTGPAAARLAALAWALASADPGMALEGLNREPLMNLLVLAAFLICVPAARRAHAEPSSGAGAPPVPATPNTLTLLAAGALLGAASLLKTVAAAHWLALALWLIIAHHRTGRHIIPRILLLLSLAPAALWAATYIYFAATQRSAEFLDAVFTYNLGYGDVSGPWPARFARFFAQSDVFRSAAPLWIAAAAAFALLLAQRPRALGPALALTLGSFVAVCLPGRFWPHYYGLMLPALVLLVSLGFASLRAGPPGTRRAAGPLLALTLVGLAFTQWTYFLSLPPDRIARFRYGVSTAWARVMGRGAAAVTQSNDSIYVWGNEAGIYYYSGRRCASRFTMNGALVAPHANLATRRAALLEDLASDRPRLILVSSSTEPPFEELDRLIRAEYVYVGADAGQGPGRPPRVQVLADAARPVAPLDWTWSEP